MLKMQVLTWMGFPQQLALTKLMASQLSSSWEKNPFHNWSSVEQKLQILVHDPAASCFGSPCTLLIMSWKCLFRVRYLLRKTGDGPQVSEKVDRFGQVSYVVVGGQGQPSLRQCTKMLLLLELWEIPTPRTRKIIVPRSVIEPNLLSPNISGT